MTGALDFECPKCGAPPGSGCVGHEHSPRVHVERGAKVPSVPQRYTVGMNAYPELGPPHTVLDNKEREAIAGCWSREKAQLIVDALNYPPMPRIPEL